MKQVDGLKKIETKRAQNLLGPRPIRPISGLRIQDSVQLLQEQLHDSVIFYEPCFAKNRTNPHVYVCMFVRNIYYIYIYIYLIHCFTSHTNLINVWLHTIQQKQVAKAPQWWLPLGSTAAGSLEGPMLSSVPVQIISIHRISSVELDLIIKNCPYTPHLCQAIQDHWFTTTSWSHYHSGVPWQHERLLGEKIKSR